MSRGSGDMLPSSHTFAAPRCTCHMPGPARSAVTTISSTATAGEGWSARHTAAAKQFASTLAVMNTHVAVADRMQQRLQVFGRLQVLGACSLYATTVSPAPSVPMAGLQDP